MGTASILLGVAVLLAPTRILRRLLTVGRAGGPMGLKNACVRLRLWLSWSVRGRPEGRMSGFGRLRGCSRGVTSGPPKVPYSNPGPGGPGFDHLGDIARVAGPGCRCAAPTRLGSCPLGH